MTRLRNGFTLIELMVTLTVAAIVMTVGIPSFSALIRNNRLTTTVNRLVGAISFARSEAVKRGIPATLCKRNSNGTACNNGGSWDDGWIVFVDRNGDGVFDDDGDTTPCEENVDDCVVRLYPPLHATINLSFPRNRVTFSASGSAQGFNGIFTFCDDRGAAHAKGRILSRTGRLRASPDTNHDGIPEDGSGNNLSCP